MSFLELRFLGEKWPFWLWEGALSLSKSHLKSQKRHFYEKMNALNDAKIPELSKSVKETGNICARL